MNPLEARIRSVLLRIAKGGNFKLGDNNVSRYYPYLAFMRRELRKAGDSKADKRKAMKEAAKKWAAMPHKYHGPKRPWKPKKQKAWYPSKLRTQEINYSKWIRKDPESYRKALRKRAKTSKSKKSHFEWEPDLISKHVNARERRAENVRLARESDQFLKDSLALDQLKERGEVEPVPGRPGFWRRIERRGEGGYLHGGVSNRKANPRKKATPGQLAATAKMRERRAAKRAEKRAREEPEDDRDTFGGEPVGPPPPPPRRASAPSFDVGNLEEMEVPAPPPSRRKRRKIVEFDEEESVLDAGRRRKKRKTRTRKPDSEKKQKIPSNALNPYQNFVRVQFEKHRKANNYKAMTLADSRALLKEIAAKWSKSKGYPARKKNSYYTLREYFPYYATEGEKNKFRSENY